MWKKKNKESKRSSMSLCISLYKNYSICPSLDVQAISHHINLDIALDFFRFEKKKNVENHLKKSKVNFSLIFSSLTKSQLSSFDDKWIKQNAEKFVAKMNKFVERLLFSQWTNAIRSKWIFAFFAIFSVFAYEFNSSYVDFLSSFLFSVAVNHKNSQFQCFHLFRLSREVAIFRCSLNQLRRRRNRTNRKKK